MAWTGKSVGCRRCITASMMLLMSFVFSFSTRAESNRSIKVMTQNMDAGTDLKLVFYYLQQGSIETGVTYTLAELLQNDIPGRAARLADEIAAKKPDIISLQEVTLWRTGTGTGEANDVLFDQLALLMAALSNHNVAYEVVDIQELTDITAPLDPVILAGLGLDPQLTSLRFTDQDVMLARTDRKKSGIALSNPQHGLYAASLDFTPLGLDVTALRGWLSVDVSIGDEALRVFGTHLESTYAGTGAFDDYARYIQGQQAVELIGLMEASGQPVILAGDFNSNPVPNGFENTGTTALFDLAGYMEIWGALHPYEPGFTWPLYLEDPLSTNPAGPFERIDLIYQKGLEMQNIERIIRNSYPFASDHVGVVAMLRVDK